MAKQRILVQVEPDLYERLSTLSRRSGVPVAEIAGDCVREAFEVVEKAILARPDVREHIDKLLADAKDLLALRQSLPEQEGEEEEGSAKKRSARR